MLQVVREKNDDDEHLEKPFWTTQQQKILLCRQNLILSYRASQFYKLRQYKKDSQKIN